MAVATAEHRPAVRSRRFRHDTLVAVDLFSGFGGLTTGIKRAGFETIMAANHNRYKVEVHEANHPEAEHWIADLVDRRAGCAGVRGKRRQVRACRVADVRIDLPWTAPPLTANQRLHWASKAKITRQIRAATAILAKAAKAPRTERLVVTLHYRPKTHRTRDRHNLWPTVKACVDGIVDAGVVADDDTEHVSTPEPVIHPPDTTGAALWLVLHYPES